MPCVAVILGLGIPGAASAAAPTQTRLQTALQRFAEGHPSYPGVAIAVHAPRLEWTGTAVVAGRPPLDPQSRFRIASVTKTFVAAAVLRLVEEGRLRLDDPAAASLSSRSVAVLRRGGYSVDRITVRQLLQHTSGLYDYASDPAYQSYVLGHGRHHWTRTEQLRFAVGHGKPLAPPGTRFQYSDTGYILLGEILERRTGRDLGSALKSLLRFDRLGLRATFLETGAARRVPRAHQYYRTLDTTGFDPSFDLYGGGGLVSTVDDLTRFYVSLLSGRVFDHRATLHTMLGKANPRRVGDLGMGIFSDQIGSLSCWAHSGFWGTTVVSCPSAHTTVALAVDQAEGFDRPSQRFIGQILRIIR